jgi:riboflavin kinase/FMN adenylyltransferase
VPARPRNVAIGTFDGVHHGHRKVIADADAVVTFSPHPRAVVGQAPPLLQDLERKIEVLGSLGVGEIVLIPFDRELAAMSPADFIERILVRTLGVTRLAVGANFHFGSRGAGSVADLIADPRFETRVEPLFVLEGDVVSSTRIRDLIAAGEIEGASRLLGDQLRFRCLVAPDGGEGAACLHWPTGLVRPAAGTYAATLEGPDGAPVGVRLQVCEGADKVLSATGPISYGAAVLCFDCDTVRTETKVSYLYHADEDRRPRSGVQFLFPRRRRGQARLPA